MAKDSAQGHGLSRLFNDRKIATKISIGFACVLIITAVISASAYLAFGRVATGFDAFALQSSNGARASKVDSDFMFVRWQAREYLLTADAVFLDAARKGLATAKSTLR